MRRRVFLTSLLAGTLAGPLPVSAQAQKTVGVLLPRDADAFWTVFRASMQEHGYVEGRDIAFEIRTAGERSLADLAAELAHINVAIIVAFQTPAAQAAKAATSKIPIVAVAGDLVATGLVASLSHPGGNLTGVSGATAELAGKCVELLREALPLASRLAVLSNADDPFAVPFQDEVLKAATATKFEVVQLSAPKATELEAAFSR